MAVILMYTEARGALSALIASWAGQRRIGLFQNDWEPQPGHSISAVQPCTFSGYDGTHDLLGWSTPMIEGVDAVSRATERLWQHNGGPVANWVFGYYVVDAQGVLRWAERSPDGPVLIMNAGGFYRVVPTFAIRSRFPTEP